MGKVKSTKEKQISAILRLLDSEYGTDDKCYLSYEKPYELLFSTIMSAQCTDERVNMVTAKLYKKYDGKITRRFKPKTPAKETICIK